MTFGRTSRAEIAQAVRSTGAGLRRIDVADQHLTSREVAQATGVSLRQLQWWDEQGLVGVPMEGHGRRWTKDHVRMVNIIAALRAKLIPLHQIRRGLKELSTARKGDIIVWIPERAKVKLRARIVYDAQVAISEAVFEPGPVYIVRVP